MTVLVDSNVIIDVVNDDPVWGRWSSSALERHSATDVLAVNPIIFAEVSAGLGRIEDVDWALPPSDFRRDPLPYEAAFLAGKAFIAYRRRGGKARAPLPDFYVGAHAAVCGYRLLTRDARRYRDYFPRLDIVAPPGE